MTHLVLKLIQIALSQSPSSFFDQQHVPVPLHQLIVLIPQAERGAFKRPLRHLDSELAYRVAEYVRLLKNPS